MRVIFLDFDGVLNSEASFRLEVRKRTERIQDTLCPVNCSNFQFILEKVPDVQVVISSTWRVLHELNWLKEKLSSYNIDSSRVIGITPRVFSGYRGKEIKEWLEDHSEVTDFVIIDDASDMEPYMDKLIQTHWKTGLLLPQAEEVVIRLSGKAPTPTTLYNTI